MVEGRARQATGRSPGRLPPRATRRPPLAQARFLCHRSRPPARSRFASRPMSGATGGGTRAPRIPTTGPARACASVTRRSVWSAHPRQPRLGMTRFALPMSGSSREHKDGPLIRCGVGTAGYRAAPILEDVGARRAWCAPTPSSGIPAACGLRSDTTRCQRRHRQTQHAGSWSSCENGVSGRKSSARE